MADHNGVRAEFSGHPHVSIEAIGPRNPPERYHVQFRLRGLALEGDQPVYRDVHEAEIQLTLEYPRGKPYCVPLTPIFHPNIKDYFCIADYWAAGMSLVDVVVKLGDMIQWKVYNPKSPLDAIAARWAIQQEQTGTNLFPTGNVNLGVADFEIQLKSTATVEQELAAATLEPLPADLGELVPVSVEELDDEPDFVVAIRR